MSPDVIIVGAGFAGLSAGAALAEAGARVLVVEARPQLGGRATAFVDRVTGELVDNGQHVLFGCYRETLAFLARIGATGHVERQATLRVPYLDRGGRRSELACPRLPAPLHLLAGVVAWNAIPLADRLAAVRIAPALLAARRELRLTGRIAAGGSATVSAWLRAHGQRERLIEWLWSPLAVAALNQSPDEASAAPFVRVLAEMFGPDADASAMVLPSRPLHRMYAEPARDFIAQRGGQVRTKALARIVVDGEAVAGVDVRGERIPAPIVVSAVPWHSMRTLFGDAPAALAPLLAAAAGMTSKAIVTVNLWYDRRVMDDVFVGLPGREMQWVFDKRTVFGSHASHLSLVASGADALAAEGSDAVVQRAAEEVRGALPGARHASLVRATVVRERHATFSLAPGQPARPGTPTAVAGLFLAGDWIDTGLPGTIESAVVAGHRAARSVAEYRRR